MDIRIFTADDIEFAAGLTHSEGWLSETPEVFHDFYHYRPDGCFIAEEEGRRVGMVVAAPYGRDGFIGELIVHPEWRGAGRGKALMAHAIAFHTASGVKNVYLDGVLAAVPLYERLGFRKICRSLRFSGKLSGEKTAPVEKMLEDDLPEVIRLDHFSFGADRSFFLRQKWFRSQDTCFVYRTGGRINGFLMASKNRIISVGPWVQEHSSDDPALLLALAAAIRGERLRLGVLESNKQAADMLIALGLELDLDSPWRMVLGQRGLGEAHTCLAIGSAASG
ncbi:MAG: GNAT family N-acetyltransferase [Anaerolineales bacterium]|nr:GNAT family N-acetyltransferase [Anaerolineales bacterium]